MYPLPEDGLTSSGTLALVVEVVAVVVVVVVVPALIVVLSFNIDAKCRVDWVAYRQTPSTDK